MGSSCMLTANSCHHEIENQRVAEHVIERDQARILLHIQKLAVQAYLLFLPGPEAMPAGLFKPGSSLVMRTGSRCMHSAAPHLCIRRCSQDIYVSVMGIRHSQHLQRFSSIMPSSVLIHKSPGK